ncbi:zinc finger MYM-type protein 1-like [Aphis craccivora]|uniref:Zinc finger MYM-type protein 1-like n=1 Tax=Aphis craccivora TaxID=307492 RepID=A0A6G0VYR4_APHCR|nr:zinc finger MYM-type protein 1-like [Aphis craccivora]
MITFLGTVKRIFTSTTRWDKLTTVIKMTLKAHMKHFCKIFKTILAYSRFLVTLPPKQQVIANTGWNERIIWYIPDSF